MWNMKGITWYNLLINVIPLINGKLSITLQQIYQRVKVQCSLVGGWAYPSEKYEFVSWDDEIPNIWNNKFMFQTTNQFMTMDPAVASGVWPGYDLRAHLLGQLVDP